MNLNHRNVKARNFDPQIAQISKTICVNQRNLRAIFSLRLCVSALN